MNREHGFTLIEILVTIGIMLVVAGLIIGNLSRGKVDLNQVSLQVVNAIRQAQSLAFSGSLLANGSYSCGYGVHFTASSYTIFAAPAADPVTGCPTAPASVYTYTPPSGSVTVIQAVTLPSGELSFTPVPPDVFFEPPFARVHISDATDPAVIQLVRGGSSCPGVDCRTIKVYTSRRIEQQ